MGGGSNVADIEAGEQAEARVVEVDLLRPRLVCGVRPVVEDLRHARRDRDARLERRRERAGARVQYLEPRGRRRELALEPGGLR